MNVINRVTRRFQQWTPALCYSDAKISVLKITIQFVQCYWLHIQGQFTLKQWLLLYGVLEVLLPRPGMSDQLLLLSITTKLYSLTLLNFNFGLSRNNTQRRYNIYSIHNLSIFLIILMTYLETGFCSRQLFRKQSNKGQWYCSVYLMVWIVFVFSLIHLNSQIFTILH